MATLNVFKGPDSVVNFFDPDQSPPLPLVEIPDRLNPYREDGVRIYAKLLTTLPAQNVKSLPALNMLQGKPEASEKSIVEASSGSTVLSMGIVSRVLWGNENVTAFVTNKKHKDSLKLLRFFGLNISLYGGLAQQEPTDPSGIMERLRRRAKVDDTVCYPGQYDNPDNWKSHERWTGRQTLMQLPEINLFSTTVGTGGCITGTGRYLKAQKPSVTILGVFNTFGDPTPGPRHLHGFKSCGFPWKETIDHMTEVSSERSYRMSMRLCREGLIAGPSSGEALQGLLDYIGEVKSKGSLPDLADDMTGEVSCVFTCSDLPYQYLDGYFTKLNEDEFPSIENEILLSCDQYRHDERWIIDPVTAAEMLDYPSLSSRSSVGSEWERPEKFRHTVLCRKKHHSNRSSNLWRWIKPILSCTSSKQDDGSGVAPDCDQPTVGIKSQKSGRIVVIDLRATNDYQAEHIRGSLSAPLAGLSRDTAGGDLFGDAAAVYDVSQGLEALLAHKNIKDTLDYVKLQNLQVFVVCYDGDASRLATAKLREDGITASSILGGMKGLRPS